MPALQHHHQGCRRHLPWARAVPLPAASAPAGGAVRPAGGTPPQKSGAAESPEARGQPRGAGGLAPGRPPAGEGTFQRTGSRALGGSSTVMHTRSPGESRVGGRGCHPAPARVSSSWPSPPANHVECPEQRTRVSREGQAWPPAIQVCHARGPAPSELSTTASPTSAQAALASHTPARPQGSAAQVQGHRSHLLLSSLPQRP